MQPISVIRDWQISILRHSQISYRYLLEQTDPAALTRYRDGGTGWTALETLCHLRDYEAIFLVRAKLTMEQDFPDLPFTPPDTMAEEHAYNQQAVWEVYADWVKNREAFFTYLADVPEAGWERAGNHPRRGRFTLLDQLMLISWHDLNHMEQIVRTLSEKLG